MKKWMPLLLVVTFGCATNPSLVMDKVVENYGSVQSLQEEIECYVAPLGVNLSGTASFKEPCKMKCDFEEPMEAGVISDGKDMYIAVPAYQTVLKLKVGDDSQELSPLHIVTFFFPERPLGSLKEKYTAKSAKSDNLDGQKVDRLEIIPKEDMDGMSKAVLWVDGETGAVRKYETVDAEGNVSCRVHYDAIDEVSGTYLPKEVRIEEGNGNLVGTLSVSEITLNPSLGDDLFDYDPPDDLMVVEEVPMLGIPMPDIVPLQ